MLLAYGLRPHEVDNISSVMIRTWDRMAYHEHMKDLDKKKLQVG